LFPFTQLSFLFCGKDKTILVFFFPSFIDKLHFCFPFSFLFMGFISRCFGSGGCCKKKYFMHCMRGSKNHLCVRCKAAGCGSNSEIWQSSCRAWPPPPNPPPNIFGMSPPLSRLLDFFKFFFVCRNRAFSYYKRWDGVGRPITIYLYNILSLSGGRRPFHPSILSSVPSSIHPSSSSRKKKMMDDETVYPNVYVIQSCSL
jgi:hypothetical protein